MQVDYPGNIIVDHTVDQKVIITDLSKLLALDLVPFINTGSREMELTRRVTKNNGQ